MTVKQIIQLQAMPYSVINVLGKDKIHQQYPTNAEKLSTTELNR